MEQKIQNVCVRKTVIASLRIEGMHNWPDCNIPEVDFLRHPHRHMFHIKAGKLVGHNNRDQEIIMLKRDIKDELRAEFGAKRHTHNFGNMSCEDIAEFLINKLRLSFCEVLEDGENGAHLEVVPNALEQRLDQESREGSLI